MGGIYLCFVLFQATTGSRRTVQSVGKEIPDQGRTKRGREGEKRKSSKNTVSKSVRNTAGSTSHARHTATSHASHEPHSHALPHTPHNSRGLWDSAHRRWSSRVTAEPGRSPGQQESRDGQWPAGGERQGDSALPRSELPIKGQVGGAFLIQNPHSPIGCLTPGARPRLLRPPGGPHQPTRPSLPPADR